MIKPSNWPHWPQPGHNNNHDAGASLIAMLVALAIATCLFSIMATTALAGFKAYRVSTNYSEAMQNACIALNWLQRDLQATRTLTLSSDHRKATLELPRVRAKDITALQWYEASYQLKDTQLQRDISGSKNIVAEGVIDFTITVDKVKPIAAISVASQSGTKKVKLQSKVWLRNLGQ
jgi:hypothetical protein